MLCFLSRADGDQVQAHFQNLDGKLALIVGRAMES
jgi:hypothetical protein